MITILSELTQRAVVASNVTAPSFFRVIAQIQPTLFIDEADTFMLGNDELRGILNSSYFKKTAFVLRAVNLSGQNQNGNGEAPNGASSSNYSPGILRFSLAKKKTLPDDYLLRAQGILHSHGLTVCSHDGEFG